MLMHWTSKGGVWGCPFGATVAELSICCATMPNSCLKQGSFRRRSTVYSVVPDTASLVRRWRAVTRLIAFISDMW